MGFIYDTENGSGAREREREREKERAHEGKKTGIS